MEKKSRKSNKKKLRKSPIFLIALFNFLIIILIAIYFIYLRFVPYKTITYDGYAVSGKDLVNNLLNPSFDVDQSINALEVKDQDDIYQNFKSFYVGAAKEKNINLDYPIYINDKLALYNLSKDMKLITTDLKIVENKENYNLGMVLGIIFISFLVILFIVFLGITIYISSSDKIITGIYI